MVENITKNLGFFTIDKGYISFLKDSEIQELGFSKVPNCNYTPPQKEKFACGVVFKIGEYNYFAPVSSFCEQKEDNVVLYDKNSMPTSSIRLNYMFPVPNGAFKLYDFSAIEDKKYAELIKQEYVSANKQYDKVIRQAASTYQKVNNYVKNFHEPHWACNFKFLESKCAEWQKLIDRNKTDERFKREIQYDVPSVNDHTISFTNLQNIDRDYGQDDGPEFY